MEASFDKAATNYDTTFTHSVIGKLQRNRVYFHVSKKLNSVKTLLEINCGTGEDAIWLAQKNIVVTATDISSQMIEIGKSKSNLNNLNFIQTDINEIKNQFSNEKFDLIFSNFGGLNCLSKSELTQFFNSSQYLLSDNGKLALVIMPKNTLWEQLFFVMKLDFKNAFRRRKKNAIANVDGKKVTTYYYNPEDILTLSSHDFKILETKPIGFFVPPSYLESFFHNKPKLISFLNTLEKKITHQSWLSKYADHYLIILEKK
ncbi:MAG: class I SAM-dependent methyltransferase [Flavobacterium sp.]|uniref:class I SAM-dependent methyltransferase n=1 Tax=Flavobacterium sp. TaxID=239 RepID=UPI003BBB8819